MKSYAKDRLNDPRNEKEAEDSQYDNNNNKQPREEINNSGWMTTL